MVCGFQDLVPGLGERGIRRKKKRGEGKVEKEKAKKKKKAYTGTA